LRPATANGRHGGAGSLFAPGVILQLRLLLPGAGWEAHVAALWVEAYLVSGVARQGSLEPVALRRRGLALIPDGRDFTRAIASVYNNVVQMLCGVLAGAGILAAINALSWLGVQADPSRQCPGATFPKGGTCPG
jgi:hypothetical protein